LLLKQELRNILLEDDFEYTKHTNRTAGFAEGKTEAKFIAIHYKDTIMEEELYNAVGNKFSRKTQC
jgi:hypothetical protein